MAVFFKGATGGGGGRIGVANGLPATVADAVMVEVLPAEAETAGICAGAGRNPASSRTPESVRRIERGKGKDGGGRDWGDFIGAGGGKFIRGKQNNIARVNGVKKYIGSELTVQRNNLTYS